MAGESFHKRSLEKLAKSFGISNPRLVKEQTEFALVGIYRQLAQDTSKSIQERFEDILLFYQRQVNLSLRTSTSVMLQQYSTPAPIAFLMGIYTDIHQAGPTARFLEPSAGNGLLTIAGKPEHFIVNELDEIRWANLLRENYCSLSQKDASRPDCFQALAKQMDALVMNPPFGALAKQEYQNFNGYVLKDLDHLMAALALATLKEDGKAAIIIGGHTSYDAMGRIQAGKNRVFLNYLYSHYVVEDIINIKGDLYSRMGTSFNIRLILINGRKSVVSGYAPLYQAHLNSPVNTFHALYTRIIS
jgi:predicted RNA methylase